MTAQATSSPAALMARARQVLQQPELIPAGLPIRVGVDLGTASIVVTVTDADGWPLACPSRPADVVRDGVVWDFAGAIEIVIGLVGELERRTGRPLGAAAVTIPPGVSGSDHRAHGYILDAAGLECCAVVDEPSAANAVLGLRDAAVVDIGGGTTGIAILRDGNVAHTIDEPSGGTHVSLVVAGALGVSLAEAERIKVDPSRQAALLPVVRPVLEKFASIVGTAIAGQAVQRIVLVGGTCAFPRIDQIMTEITGIASEVAPEPLLVTPVGVASWGRLLTSSEPKD